MTIHKKFMFLIIAQIFIILIIWQLFNIMQSVVLEDSYIENIEEEQKYFENLIEHFASFKAFIINIDILKMFNKKVAFITISNFKRSLNFGINELNFGGFLNKSKIFNKNFNCELKMFHGTFFNKTAQVVTNIYFECKYLTFIQLAIFYERNNYCWIGSSSIGSKNNNKWFGDTPRLMSQIKETTEIRIGKIKILIPSDLKKFLYDYDHSVMRECNSLLAAENLKLSNGKYKQNLKKNSRVLPGLKYIIEKFETNFKSYWIDSGSLLGWYRDCGIIKHTTVCKSYNT